MKSFMKNDRLDIENGKYLLGIPDTNLTEILMKGREEADYKWDGGISGYKKKLKRFLKTAIPQMEQNGLIKNKYKYSKELVTCGRRCVVDFGIQGMTAKLKGFLCSKLYYDIDIINCAPTILFKLTQTNFPNFECKYLKKYINERENFLKIKGVDKQTIIACMYDSKHLNFNDQIMIKLDIEIKKIQKLFFNDFDKKFNLPDIIVSKKDTLKQNKYGKYLNAIITFFENNFLETVENKLSVSRFIDTLIYDGFHLLKSNEYNIEEIITELNNIEYNKMTLKWKVKDFDTSLKIDEGINLDLDLTADYNTCKINFEENHFIIENPMLYGREYEIKGETKYQFYSKEKFRELVRPIKYFDDKDKEFFPEWMADAKRRAYKEVRFIPTLKKENDLYNSFEGFNY